MNILKRFITVLCCGAAALTAIPLRSAMPQASAAQNASAQISEEIGLVANLFCAGENTDADHAALQWATTLSASRYVLYRSEQPETGFEQIYSGTGTSCEDGRLTTGKTYYYQLKAETAKGDWYSGVKSVTACAVPSGLSTYDNQKGSSLVYETGGYLVNGTYYSYSLQKHAGKNDIYLAETTSSDGKRFGNERNVADSSQNEMLASCKIESVHIDYRPNINKVVVWAHWEKESGYSDGKALVITGTPGGQFTVHHVYNPLDIQVRDMAIFFDDDDTGYLIAAANKSGQSANATLYIFRMNEDYSGVTEIVTTLFEDQYREFPNMIKKDGHYFLFTSQAAGWYPSSGAYAVADRIDGKWSGLRSIGNTSTFSSQSGWIVSLQDKNYLMHAYRWLRASETSGTTLCPLYFDNSFAFYDYYPSFRYSTKTGDLYPVQRGELLSQDRPASSSLGANDKNPPAKAFDGSYQTSFSAIEDYKKWPFYLQVDLERVCNLSNIQTSWYICKGSEGYYAYTVEGSTDGENWTKLLDHTDTSKEVVSKTYGFNSDMLSGKARFVRLNVKSATLQNNPTNNWYNPTVYEVKIFGSEAGPADAPKPAAAYNFEQSSGSSIADMSGSGRELKLFGDTAVTQDAQRGNVLRFGGSADDYAALPSGLLDQCREYTICMDAKSSSDGNFFTFAAGQDENKYAFFKIAKDHFRFQTTVNTWKGETGLRTDLDGTQWHHYAFVVSGGSAVLYVDGVPAAETVGLTTGPADMGSNLKVLLGKSFYADDVGYSGYLDNVAVYRRALTADEVRGLQNGAEPLPGDINADGQVSRADAEALVQYLTAGTEPADWKAGDLDGNGTLTAADLSMLKQLLFR
ncbi:MAG: discoidin domain-containing protein [Oscillospiraceae bacterium]|nr:discoidin domain-containing protein [Oscillospiraceae bacterium]